MISTDLITALSQWALSVEKQRATLAADNIAQSSISGTKKTGNFSELLARVGKQIDTRSASNLTSSLNAPIDIKTSNAKSLTNRISLDEEVAEISAAKGRYKVIAESLARKYSLMAIASKGK